MWRSDPPPQQGQQHVPAAVLTGGGQPPRTMRGLATLFVVAMAWPQVNEPRPVQPFQGRSQIAPLTIRYGSQPVPCGPLAVQEVATIRNGWPELGEPRPVQPTQGRQWLAPLTLTYGSPPQPQGPLSSQELSIVSASWQPPAWTAQSEPDSAGWNTTLTPVLPPTPASLLAQYAGSWQSSWSAQRAPVTPTTLSYGGQIPPAASPALLGQYGATWVVNWSAQRSAEISPLTLVYGDQPQLPAVSPTIAAQYITAWQVAWEAQGPSTVVPLTLAYGTPPQLPAAPPDLLTRYAASWSVTWAAQTPAPTAAWNVAPAVPPPLSPSVLGQSALAWGVSWASQGSSRITPLTLATGDLPPIDGALNEQEIAILVGAWAVDWRVQSAAPNAAWNVPAVSSVPPTAQPISILQSWTPVTPPVQRPVALPVTGAFGDLPGPSLAASRDALQRMVAAWRGDWSAQRSASIAPLTLATGTAPLAGRPSSVPLSAFIPVTWLAQSAAPNAGWNVPVVSQVVVSPIAASPIATWWRAVEPTRMPSRTLAITGTYGDQPGPSQARSAAQQARLASSWIADWRAQTAAPVASWTLSVIERVPPARVATLFSIYARAWQSLPWTAQSAALGADRDIGGQLQPAIATWVANPLTSTGGASTTGKIPFAPKRIKIPGYRVGSTAGMPTGLATELQKVERSQSNSDTVIIQHDYQLMVTDRMVLVDTSIGDVTISLLPAKIRFELPITIAKISSDSNNVIVHAALGDNINDSGGLEWSDAFVAYSMHPDGATHWWLEGVNEHIVKLTPGTYTKIVVNANGRAIAGLTTIEEQDILLQDITTNDANSFRHGFMPKIPVANGDYVLRVTSGVGTWVPA